MSSEVAIAVEGLGKSYQIYNKPADRLKQSIFRGRRRYFHDFWALQGVNFQVKRGETFGIIGRNGSGKSTLLQLICGTLTPTEGAVTVNGRIAALLELGAGFNPEFTGRENVYMNASILGFTPKETDRRFADIHAFSEIGEFIEQPVKTYSSGMYVRLAFAVAINTDPDILVVDEALSVGDARFQQKCMTRIRQLQENGVSILFCSHDSESVKRLCQEVLVLDKGRVVNRGPAHHMTNWYLAFLTADCDLEKLKEMEEGAQARSKRTADKQTSDLPGTDGINEPGGKPSLREQDFPEFKYFRHGDGNATITGVEVLTANGQSSEVILWGSTITVRVSVEFNTDVEEHLIGIILRDRLGTDVIGINTFQEQVKMPTVKQGDRYSYDITFPVHLKPGHYSISPSVAYHQYRMEWLDWIENALVVQVVDPQPDRLMWGIYLPSNRQVSIRPSTTFSPAR